MNIHSATAFFMFKEHFEHKITGRMIHNLSGITQFGYVELRTVKAE